jgi:hypothetical protein
LGLVELGTYKYPDWNDRIRKSKANMVWDIEISYAEHHSGMLGGDGFGGGDRVLPHLGLRRHLELGQPDTPQYEVDKNMYEPSELTSFSPVRIHRESSDLPTAMSRLVHFSRRGRRYRRSHVFDTYDQIHNAVVADDRRDESCSGTSVAGSRSMEAGHHFVPGCDGRGDVRLLSVSGRPGDVHGVQRAGLSGMQDGPLAIAADLFRMELNNPASLSG